MSTNKSELVACELLSNYIRIKVKNNLGSSVSSEEFQEYTTWLLNQLNGDRSFSNSYSLDEEDFNEICKSAVGNQRHTNWLGKELVFQDDKILATYNLTDRDTTSGFVDTSINYYLGRYIEEQVETKKYQVSCFPVEVLTGEEEILTKKISIHILRDLMRRYVESKIEYGRWPKQCTNVDEYILEKDLASIIELDGTKDAFLNVYINATRVIGELVAKNDNFQISNNSSRCLAFSNYLDIVGPYSFISKYRYDPYTRYDKELNIEVINEDVERKRGIFNDRCEENYAIDKYNLKAIDYSKIDTLVSTTPVIMEKVKAKRISKYLY